jgi:hypothetical protein
MKKIILPEKIFVLIFTALIFCPVLGFGYILPPQYILELMIKKRGNLKDLEIRQDLLFYDAGFPKGQAKGKEILYYRIPREFRVDGNYQSFKQVWVNQGNQYVILTDGLLTDEGRFDQSLLKDIFMAETGEELMQRIRSAGIDTSKVSLGKKDKSLYYIIGADYGDFEKPQLWINKDSFRPFNLRIQERFDDKKVNAEVRFEDFGKNTPSWYPGLTEIYYDDVLIASLRAQKVSTRLKLPDQLFNIREIKEKNPAAEKVNRNTSISSSRIGETIKLLRKRL